MTVQPDTHKGSGKAAARDPANGFADTIETAEAGLRQAGVRVELENRAALNRMLASSHGWMGWARDAGQANLKAWQALLACRSAEAAIAVQSALFQEQLKLFADSARAT